VFWGTAINDYSFRRASGSHEHSTHRCARFWKTRYDTQDGDRLYVGTVSIAPGLMRRSKRKAFVDNDGKRKLLFKDLLNAKKIAGFKKIRLENPAVIKSVHQNRILTDGSAYFIRLP
jgi:hypothetical protein